MEKDENKGAGVVKTAAAKKKDPTGTNKNTIIINPKLEEAKGGTVVLGWGRMNPITTGHEKLVNKIVDVARKQNATPLVYLTHSQNAKKDPLSYNDKIMLAQRAFGKIVQKSNSNTIIKVMQELQGKYKDVVLVVGEDRIKEFDTLLNKYNGKDYTFDSIKVVSAGSRVDPDSEQAKEMTAASMSASVMRKLASEGDFETFKKGLPKKLQSNAQDVYDMVRGGMKIAEQIELDEAVLSIQQRRQRAIMMRRYKTKIQAARKRLMKRPATKEKIKLRARKKAIQIIRNMVAGKKGQNYADLSPSEKAMIDQRVQKRKKAIDRIAIKLLPKIKKADMQRISSIGKSTNEEFEIFIETIQTPKQKRYHQARNKDGSMKYDKRFKSFKNVLDENAAQERAKEKHAAEKEAMKDRHTAEINRAKRRDLNREITKSRNEEFEFIHSIDEALDLVSSNINILESLEGKAHANNVDLSILIDVYKSALDEDHDYDLTQQQYAFASVNTYLANLAEGVNDPGIFKAVFLAGGPGSGKSFIVGKTALTAMGLKLINSDDAFEHQLKKVGLSTTPEDIYSDLGQSVRGKAKALTAKRQSIALMGRLGLVIDGTGKDFDKIKKQADELKRIGYEVAMIFVNTDLDTAQARNKARTRTLPEKEVKDMWDAVQKNMGKFQNYFGSNFVIVDNSDGANYEGAVNNAYRKMSAWVKKDPIKPTAKKWIKTQKAERGMKEELNLDESFEAILDESTEAYGKSVEKGRDDAKKDAMSNRDKTKMAAIASMMNREKQRRQHDLAQKARERGDTDAAQKHDTQARKIAREQVELEEKLKVSDGLGAWIKDFQDSDAPQFEGKDKEKRRKMAIAAFVDAGGILEEVEHIEEGMVDSLAKDFEKRVKKQGYSSRTQERERMATLAMAKKKGASALDMKNLDKAMNTIINKLDEEVEQIDENMSRVAKELEAYARKNGGIDKMDFMKAAMMMKKGQKSQLMKFVDDLDTEPREKILSLIDKDAQRRKEYNKFQKAKRSIKEAVASGKQKAALKALMRQALGGKAPGKGYTSSIATNGDFVVYDGGMRIQGRIKKGDFTDPMKG